MTSRERLIKVLKGEIPDCVPVAPDTSNMIPARLTGKPLWDIYLYQDMPIWSAYIDCVKHFGFDSLMDGYATIKFEELGEIDHDWVEVIIEKSASRIVTQKQRKRLNGFEWDENVTVYHKDNPPSIVSPDKVNLPQIPAHWEPIEGRIEYPEGAELLQMVKAKMGDHGLVGVNCGTSNFIWKEQQVYDYYDDPKPFYEMRDRYLENVEKRFNKLISLPLNQRPDFICTGGSGTLVLQSVDTFRELSLPIVQLVTKLCKKHNIPSHIHSCGPSAQLIKICAEETDLTVIDPLELPPMGDCILKDMKKLYGDKLVLKGNLHTSNTMLYGSVEDVIKASKEAIDDAADGGKFILSTGDQCGRDTPDENIFAMVETARTYGKYPLQK